MEKRDLKFNGYVADRVRLEPGDCREVLRSLPDCSVDSAVTDPPYALVSIAKRFGKAGAAPAGFGTDGAYARAARGFMGQTWDTGETAFAAAFWADVLRVLKPGGHVVAFAGTRTYHRLAVAIEDAGFEIRDQLGWLYGTGFPKSHDVSKSIDKSGGNPLAFQAFAKAYAGLVELSGFNHAEIDRTLGIKSSSCYWARVDHRGGMPPRHHWAQVKSLLGLGSDFDVLYDEAEREITGTVQEWTNRTNYALSSKDGFRRDKPASDAARQWAGWGTALKPAWEPIVLARKPLGGTVAANVLAHGTGAINVEASRVEATNGFPANVLHDGSDEVLAAFPGRESRFFYAAKASAWDRAGSEHPTVKPVSLMRWLVRLVTPPGGLVLDPFAGSGTTGTAAYLEGMRCVLVEREAAYQRDIEHRLAALCDMTRPEWA